jgi:L-ribulokinase
MPPYAIGLDFGTESARLVALDLANGAEVLVREHRYRHGVMDRCLPDGTPLAAEWALQHPDDYLEAAAALLAEAAATLDPAQVIGIGLDHTASSVLVTDGAGQPLCRHEQFAREPHAYVKLWKHHAPVHEARELQAGLGRWLWHTGGASSVEWLHAKALETLRGAPAVFDAAARVIEAGDWLVWQLTGDEVRSACQAGFKAHYRGGYPDDATLDAIEPGFAALNQRLAPPHPVGTAAGGLSAAWARRCGLRAGTPVAVALIDAHAAVPGLGVAGPGVLAIAMGTSTCHVVLAADERLATGVAGVVRDGVFPGLVAYETGQAAAGDMLAWWARLLAPSGADFAALEREAAALPDQPTGLLALDWWNGARTPLMNPALSGVLCGLRIETGRAEVYRALLEATAFGNRQVLELLEGAVVPIHEIRVSGGLSRSALLMQLLADVLGREVLVSATPHGSARGAALVGALAAGIDEGLSLCARLAPADIRRVVPHPERQRAFDDRYARYRELQQWFGAAHNDLLPALRRR